MMEFEKFLNTETGQLNLYSCGISDGDINMLCRFLQQHPEVKSLNLNTKSTGTSNQITEEGCNALVQGLKNNSAVVALHLAGNKIGNAGIRALIQLQQLTLLDVKDTGINEHGVYHLARLKKLISLDVSFNDLGELGIYAITENLKSLRILSAQSCKLHNAHAAAIADMRNLIVLNISNNHLTDAALDYIIAMKKLCFIDLRNNQFTAKGLEKLQQMHFAKIDTETEKELLLATSESISALTQEKLS